MKTLNRANLKSVLATSAIIALGVGVLYANGTEQTGFSDVWKTITEYMQGSLGRVLVGLMVVVGVASAVVRQSLMVFAVTVGAAIGLYYSPDIINGMMASTEAVATMLPTVGI
ncbi:hypothetical protein J8V57_17295 [Xenorhabdus sp. PB61.4]|uniref:TraA family conjugative transfer protein n=1 Tax=Xenorhabdus sp. PB61.4 TaxID=2788940 RepID=UPI001E4F6CCD|nr:TraA family conjugative transfer protein [Xenorhabdus sp. PB61.4]MCC8367996.1 hypothetical protein [Xenorhabdus sp. PB61.4]